MKQPVPLFLLLLLGAAGCGPNREDLQQLVREEMSRAAQKTIIAPLPVIGPYSPAVRVGNFPFVSGQIALDPGTGTMKNESIEVETRQVLDNVRRILHAAGYDSSHVISATVYLKDISNYVAMNTIYGGYFQEGAYPARVAVQVAMPQVERSLLEARERDDLYNAHKDTGKKLRTTMMLWARSHRNLCGGHPGATGDRPIQRAAGIGQEVLARAAAVRGAHCILEWNEVLGEKHITG